MVPLTTWQYRMLFRDCFSRFGCAAEEPTRVSGPHPRFAAKPQAVVVPNMPAKYPTHWPLAVGKVRFHGDALAAVVARDKYVAEDAAEAIEVDYEELPYIGDPRRRCRRTHLSSTRAGTPI